MPFLHRKYFNKLLVACNTGLLIALISLTTSSSYGYSPSYDLSYGPSDNQTGYQNVSTPIANPGGGQFDVNTFVGANTYYNAGIIGQNTRSIVAEAGTIWNGQESLNHVTNFYASSFSFGGTNATNRIDRHATWVAGVLGGRENPTNPQIYQKGIAYGTTLGSAGIANNWGGTAYSLSFSWSYNSWTGAILPTFGNADIINQSYGLTDSAGTNVYTRMMDALLRTNSQIVSVASAGNSGVAGSVGSPASGYNSISVGALGDPNNFGTIANFSSRGPQNWGYISSAGTAVVVTNARTVVDIVAPGSSIIAPFYGGQTGGNFTNLSGSTNLGTDPATYSSISGTSFSSPIVAGGASLVSSAAKTLPELQGNTEASESVVVKALLLNGATKISGWNNGQTTNNGVVTTLQGLDYISGAGSMNLSKTFTNQTQGQKGVAGTTQGSQGIVDSLGWDFGASSLSGTNTYILSGLFSSNSQFSTTLSWLRQVSMNTNSGFANASDIAEANLNLRLWHMNKDGSLGDLAASSESTYNLTEHLYFNLAQSGYYILGVTYDSNNFNNTGTWGTGTNTQSYGLAWDATSSASIYLQSNTWEDNGNWNTSSEGSTTQIANSSVAVNTIIGDGTQNQETRNIEIIGDQYTRSLVFDSAEANITANQPSTINIGSGGITVRASTTGNISLSDLSSVNLQGNQTWNNQSSQQLIVSTTIAGTGNLNISNSSNLAETRLNSLSQSGSFESSGLGKTTVDGIINDQVTSVSQSGPGSLELNGQNTYTGGTSVSAGKLKVNGSIASSSLTSINNSGTLMGSGSVGTTLVSQGGTINPGLSPGILTIEGDLTWGGFGNYNWEIHDALGSTGVGFDNINVLGSLNLNLLSSTEKFNINLWSLSSIFPDSNGPALNFDQNLDYLWVIVSTTQGVSGFNEEFFNITTIATNGTSGFANSLNGSFSLSVQNNDLVLAYNTVPEPSTYTLILVTLSILIAYQIKKRKKINKQFDNPTV
jgi:autotransporter-associated beta strand protein